MFNLSKILLNLLGVVSSFIFGTSQPTPLPSSVTVDSSSSAQIRAATSSASQTALTAPLATPTVTSTPTPTLSPSITPVATPAPVVNNTPSLAGLNTQSVQSDAGVFSVTYIAADLNTTKVVVDTASPSDCHNDCPTLPLADYVSRNNAIAGINGSFFCPTEYPGCKDQTNSFSFLLMNKNKTYFNSDQNVYSVIPAAIFQGNSARFVARSLEWGRDTSPDAVIANYPIYVLAGNSMLGQTGEAKLVAKNLKTFIGNRGSSIFIGYVSNATADEAAKTLKAFGLDNAMNLDEGGSTALWYGGRYIAGPGRNIPNAVLFVRR